MTNLRTHFCFFLSYVFILKQNEITLILNIPILATLFCDVTVIPICGRSAITKYRCHVVGDLSVSFVVDCFCKNFVIICVVSLKTCVQR